MNTLLQINTVVNSGSIGHIAEELGRFAVANGWESYIAFGRNEGTSKSKLIKIGTSWEVKLHGMQTRLFDRHGLGSEDATKILVEKIKIIKPDIIHLHNVHGYYLNIDILFTYLRKAEIPVVWTLHDCWSITGHCVHFSFVDCEKWKTQCFNCPQKKSYPSSFLFDRSKKNFKQKKELFTSIKNMTIVSVSKWLMSIVDESFISKYPTHLINNGVNLNIFSPQTNKEDVRKKYGVGKRFMLMGVATTWSERKGIKDYVKLSKILTKECIIVLVGLSPRQLKTLPKSIVGVARTENISELASLYSSADIILNLSAEETFGLTTIEGLACGTPGIVYDTTASPELITPATGYIVAFGDIAGLLSAVNLIKEKGKNFYTLACRNRVEKYFNISDRHLDYINLYNKLKQSSK